MKLKSVGLTLPERLITNDYIADRIEHYSKQSFDGDLRTLRKSVLNMLHKSGANERYWSLPERRPISYIKDAVENAVIESSISIDELDIVIYVGIDRGFYEPANAYFIADYLGVKSAQCFDIVDACNGWSRALQVCDALFQANKYKSALIISGEFPMFDGGPINPHLFQFRSLQQLRHRFPAFTLGEGAAATIVTAEEDQNWEYCSSSYPRYADLCTVTCHDTVRYAGISDRLNLDGARFFVSFGHDMIAEGLEKAIGVLKDLSTPLEALSVVFPHTISASIIDAAASTVGASNLAYSVFPRVGNLASASIPAGLSLALREGRVRKGDIAAGLVGSAGMVFSAYTFTV